MSSPKSQRLNYRFAAASDVTSDGAHSPLPATSDSGRTGSRHCSLPGTAKQALSQPHADTATSAAQPDLLAAEHPEQMEHEQPQAAAPELSNADVSLAELHAHIIAGEPCYSIDFMLPWQHHAMLAL